VSKPSVEINAALVPDHENGLPAYMDLPLLGASSPQAAKLQYLMCNPDSGMADLGDDAVPGQISGGYVRVSELTDYNASDGNARARVAWGFAVHQAPSTIANDTPDAGDLGKPLWLAPGNTPGLLSHTGTVAGANLKNRSLLGLALGRVKEGSAAIYHWVGPIAQAVARAVMMADAYPLASFGIADAAASTAVAERAIRRPKMHGRVTDVTFTGAAVVADNTDYVTITIAKRDGAGGGATTIATYDSRAASQGAITAFVPAAFALVAGTLDLLESDIVTVTTVKGGSGKTLTGEILVNGRAI